MTRSRQVINEEDLRWYVMGLASDAPPHIAEWMASTFRRWLTHESEHTKTRVFHRKELSNPFVELILGTARNNSRPQWDVSNVSPRAPRELPSVEGTVLYEMSQTDLLACWHVTHNTPIKIVWLEYWTTTLPWVRKAYDRGEDLYAFELPIEEKRSIYAHWVDYLRMAYPEPKTITETIEHVIQHVKEWDEQLKRQKLVQDLYLDAVLIPSAIMTRDRPDWRLYRLKTEGSRKAEGAFMRHCVGDDYYGTQTNAIYSVRSAETREPLYTLQTVRHSDGVQSLVQMKARFNDMVPGEDKAVIVEAFTEMGVMPTLGDSIQLGMLRYLIAEQMAHLFFPTVSRGLFITDEHLALHRPRDGGMSGSYQLGRSVDSQPNLQQMGRMFRPDRRGTTFIYDWPERMRADDLYLEIDSVPTGFGAHVSQIRGRMLDSQPPEEDRPFLNSIDVNNQQERRRTNIRLTPIAWFSQHNRPKTINATWAANPFSNTKRAIEKPAPNNKRSSRKRS